MKILQRFVCQFLESSLSTDGFVWIKVFKLFKVGDERPIGKIESYNTGYYVNRNKYANGDDLYKYPVGGIILMEITDGFNSNGFNYRFIDFENNRDDRDRSLAVSHWGRKINRNYYEDFKICRHRFMSTNTVDEYWYNTIRDVVSRAYANYREVRIMEFQDYGPLPDCVLTVQGFRSAVATLSERECIEGISIDGVLVKLLQH